MEIILHIGSHRTGTTSLQTGLGANRQRLSNHRIAYWGPKVLRNGLFAGLSSAPSLQDTDEKINLVATRKSNILLRVKSLSQRGYSKLLISEENMMGLMETNLKKAELYPNLFMRLAHYSSLFSKDCSRVGICIRQYHSYWASSLAYSIKAGFGVPKPAYLEKLSAQSRTWRDVIVEVSEMFPDAKVSVWDFDSYAGKISKQFQILSGIELDFKSIDRANRKHNASPVQSRIKEILTARGDNIAAQKFSGSSDIYMPFNPRQIAQMRLDYARDIDWLKDGAQGLATFYG